MVRVRFELPGPDVVGRSPEEMFSADRDSEYLAKTLCESYWGRSTFDVISQDESRTGAKNTGHVVRCLGVVSNGAEAKGAHDSVEGAIIGG